MNIPVEPTMAKVGALICEFCNHKVEQIGMTFICHNSSCMKSCSIASWANPLQPTWIDVV